MALQAARIQQGEAVKGRVAECLPVIAGNYRLSLVAVRSPVVHTIVVGGNHSWRSPGATIERNLQSLDASRPWGVQLACACFGNKCGTGVWVPLDKNNLIQPTGKAMPLPQAGRHGVAGPRVSAATVGAITSRRLYNNIAWDPPS